MFGVMQAVSQIKTLAAEDTKNTIEPDVEFVECDFGCLKTVKEVADKLVKKEERIDLVSLSMSHKRYFHRSQTCRVSS